MKLYLRYTTLICAGILLGGLFVNDAVSATARESITITGTGAGIGTMKLMAKEFQKKHSGMVVNVLPSIGSTGGIRAVNEDKIDIAISWRPLKPEERNATIIEEPYGRTAFIFGVQGSNPVQNLTLEEIEDIYAGKRRTWPDRTPVRLVLRPVSDGFSVYLSGINPGLKSVSMKAHAIPGVYVGNTDQDSAEQIEQTPGSFGTTSLSLVVSEKRKIKALSVNGAAPTISNVSTGTYPYANTLSLVYRKDKYRGAVKAFIEFIFSGNGKKILSNNGHVALQRVTGK
ncbi:MAG: substrate-binding domain-containing protein [Desulfuromonadaceae bacterium]|nr:substrate-binding domain-containing protein [Desulfuromonadaceae bacterium]